MQKIPSPTEIKNQFPLSSRAKNSIEKFKKTAAAIVLNQDPRVACIVGPCSIHDPMSALEYAKLLKNLSEQIDSSIFLVMRVFCEKSRSANGWKGFLYDPNLDGSHDIVKGIQATRLLLTELAELEVPIAAELLDPFALMYYQDLISWGFIGARTFSSQPHRQMASGLDFPIGFKNSIYGEILSSIQGILTAHQPQQYFSLNENGCISIAKSKGNQLCHLVLRGSNQGINFDTASIQQAQYLLQKNHLPIRLMIDCSHDNSYKNERLQKQALSCVLEQIRDNKNSIFAFMLESHLYAGCQLLSDNPAMLRYGVSITDSCIGWEETQDWLLDASRLLFSTSISSVQK